MIRATALAVALMAPAAAFAHGGHAPATPRSHGLLHLFADPASVWLGVAVLAGLAVLVGAEPVSRRRRTRSAVDKR